MEGPASTQLSTSTTRLSLAFWISRNAGCIFEVHLHFLHGLTRLQWLVLALCRLEDEAELAQNFPDGTRRSRRDDALGLQVSITLEKGEDGARSRRALQVLRRGRANLDHRLDQA